MRTQGLAGAVHLLSLVSKYRPRVVVGVQQGGVVVALAGLPLLLETACRLRAIPHTELAEFRRGWAGVQALVAVHPVANDEAAQYCVAPVALVAVQRAYFVPALLAEQCTVSSVL